MPKRGRQYDPAWLVALAREQYADEPEIAAAFERCTWVHHETEFSIYFVDSRRPNQVGSVWQFDTNFMLVDPEVGTLVVDWLIGKRVGAIEFLDRVLNAQYPSDRPEWGSSAMVMHPAYRGKKDFWSPIPGFTEDLPLRDPNRRKYPVPTLERAIEIATRAHAGQVDKAGAPYILHPLRVMLRCTGLEAQLVGVLHDVVEDTSVGLDKLRFEGFSEEVLDAVDSVTNRKGEDYFDFVRRAAKNPLGRQVKRADLEDNMDATRLTEMTAKDEERERYRKAMGLLEALSY